MAYKFNVDGVDITTDSAAEMSEFLRIHRNGAAHSNGASNALEQQHEAQAVAKFFSSINKNAAHCFLVLARYRDGISTDKLADETGVAVEKFGGTFGGATKIAKREHLDPAKFVVSKTESKGTERFKMFRPGPLLLKYVGVLGGVVK